ncbi:type VI secretion system ATPase TssH [Sulfitobacter sp. M57]|uniref:type VI secretion system ATPase TssH n=1 Tax=unclassified Sulfitobacter TaxID=196795 RepID=UPI0023E32A83|nr:MULTISPECIES: type VI secretion system ATPase TssH [unclassified Sulfitobacter]MDF3416137.1 type VI secretion system ATPase TssH [Sulfitobacter sp. KE5]MDF3423616.1 type VI secretion system ATPase TssH [Sulfitobacter sp. KE43]MDF3434582.1 type VI secretion system ATPase TssH [Sulfitobacter sp. KE42]MDF3460322.1 type VI secretion system ATPase TssH [Sulfitobacter sp. S74]MDF3464120.1 type VI secretion system ATPase TssH [Sulfitobacter sp. Ks18]
MTEITIEKYAGKMNRAGYDAFLQAMRHARSERNRSVELCHWLFYSLSNKDADLSATLAELGLDRGRVLKDLDKAMSALDKNVTETPGISDFLSDALNHAWTYATLFFGEPQIRTGHVLVALLSDPHLKRQLTRYSMVFDEISAEQISQDSRTIWANSEEDTMPPMDGSGLSSPDVDGTGEDRKGAATPLGRFAKDMTAVAATTDPIKGRGDEIRQIIDVLLRRRQNNPILTGEAGVGKTAVVEGFAQALAAGDVPPKLQGTLLYELDIQSMQAGASMKGEFEQRLKSVIDEVQNSPTPIILFIDEAHTLVGAGGAAGTGDAANILKPALARGTLRTIGATTWSEYRQYFEKDPALTRRFQPVSVDEPTVEQCCFMLRGILGPMEAHHGVRISDEAIVSAVSLSHRHIPARQLPDKAVSLLDTACARVAVSQASVPARIADTKDKIEALSSEIASKMAERDLGETDEERLTEAEAEKTKLEARLAELDASFSAEKEVVDRILELRLSLAAETPEEDAPDPEALRAEMYENMATLEGSNPDNRMVYAHVDGQAVASVISDWTGIPAGRMVQDELQAVLQLADRLQERVIGQDHGLKAIAKRIETNRAGLSNPNKPIGVFMLCGPSGVGKTETALALAEQLYGGEQNVITINMSEFQEAHTVSLLKGAPPGYVGYGEGGRLTEAVRRKPYSVVLLDEIEKAHPDVHELFFQVFDKGVMEDGNGRTIDFKNTIILLTSNVGTDVIMEMAEAGETTPDMEELEAAIKPFQLDVFPPALLGRIVSIPYFPLGRDVLTGITKLKLGAVERRLKGAHGAVITYDDGVIEHIVEQCRDPDSGGRMIDNIITNSILPDLSRQVLSRMVSGDVFGSVEVSVDDGNFVYNFA